jgi:antitoxin component of RelBE/YafQ-DinJ toxin-antitoxin module
VLPFDIKVPNAEAQAAISELEQGAGRPFGSVDDLKANLNTKD